MSTKDRTLWRNEEAKFKPRNKQAALVCIKAKPIFLPPEEIPAPVMAESFEARLARESKEREARIAENRRIEVEAQARQRRQQAMIRERQNILREIRTTVKECERKGRPVPARIEELRKMLSNFPKKGIRK